MSIFTEENAAILQEQNILQLAELISFLAGGLVKVHGALVDDGRISLPEGVGIGFAMLGQAKEAFSGLQTVGQELKGIDARKIELLGDIVFPSIQQTQTPYVAELVNRLLGVATQLAHTYQLLQDGSANWNTPPKPVVVP